MCAADEIVVNENKKKTHQYVIAPTSSDHFGVRRKTTDGAIQFAAANTAYKMLRLQSTTVVHVTAKNKIKYKQKNYKTQLLLFQELLLLPLQLLLGLIFLPNHQFL